MQLIKLLLFATAIIVSEFILSVVFRGILKFVSPGDPDYAKYVNKRTILIGMAERLFILFSLINNLPQALAFFGALKIGTRLSKESDNKIFNDFFLLGNMISVFSAFLYSRFWLQLDGIVNKLML